MTNRLTAKQWIFTFLCIAVALACYWPGLAAPFMFDSTPALRDNAALQFHNYTFDEWWAAILSSASGPVRRPVSMFTFALNAAASGLQNSFSFNVTNLAIHGLNSALVFVCVALLYRSAPRLTSCTGVSDRNWIALIAAAAFLLHPINLTAVLYTVQRMTELSCSFVLLALAIFLKCRKRLLLHGFESMTVAEGIIWISVCTVLGALAKENALLIPWLILVVEVIFFRFKLAGVPNRRVRTLTLLGFALPVAALALYLLVLRPETIPAMYADRVFTLPERLMTQAKVLWIYLYWIVVPSAPNAGLHHDDIEIARSLWQPLTVISVTAWAVVITLVIPVCVRRYPLIALALAWYLVAHLLESTIVPLELVYEHRNYAALLGITVLVADTVWRLGSDRSRQRSAVVMLFLVALAVPLGLRASLWSDEMTLAANQLRKHPESLRSRYHYANLNLQLADRATDVAERKRSALVAEHYYRLMLELDSSDIVALATLLYIDGKYFGSTDHDQLMGALLAAIEKPVFTKTDANALVFIKDCSVRRICVRSDEEYGAIVDRLGARVDIPPATIALMRASYAGEVANDPLQALDMLRAAGEQGIDTRSQRMLLAWQLETGDIPGAMESVRSIYSEDASRAKLASLRRMTEVMGAAH